LITISKAELNLLGIISLTCIHVPAQERVSLQLSSFLFYIYLYIYLRFLDPNIVRYHHKKRLFRNINKDLKLLLSL